MSPEAALAELLALPDPPELVGRGYHYTLPRHPNGRCGERCQRSVGSDPDVIKRDLGTAYVAWRVSDHRNGEVSSVVSVRRQPVLRIVKRA